MPMDKLTDIPDPIAVPRAVEAPAVLPRQEPTWARTLATWALGGAAAAMLALVTTAVGLW